MVFHEQVHLICKPEGAFSSQGFWVKLRIWFFSGVSSLGSVNGRQIQFRKVSSLERRNHGFLPYFRPLWVSQFIPRCGFPLGKALALPTMVKVPGPPGIEGLPWNPVLGHTGAGCDLGVGVSVLLIQPPHGEEGRQQACSGGLLLYGPDLRPLFFYSSSPGYLLPHASPPS